MNPAAELRANAQATWPGATVAERKRNSIKHQHPADPGRFMLDVDIGPIHYGPAADQEIDTAWQASGGVWDYEVTANDFHCFVRDSVPVSYRYYDAATSHYIELTFTAIEWVNDEGQSEAAAQFSQVTPTIDDDRITWESIATGWDVTINAQTARLAKIIDIDSLANLGTPTIGGTNPRLRISITFQKSAGLEVWANGEQWNEKNNTWIETVSNIEFRDESTLNPVFWFLQPWAADAAGSKATVTQRTRRLGVNYYAEVDIPWSWLETAAFPIQIDPTVDYQVGSSDYDAIQDVVDGYAQPSYDDRFGFSSPGGAGVYEFVGVVWQSVTIASSATIDTAYASWKTSGFGYVSMDSVIDFEDGSAPSSFSVSQNGISGRTGTTNSVAWNATLSDDAFNNTPSIVSIIQELVNSYDYSSGSTMMARLEAQSTDTCYLNGYLQSSADAAKLHIEYSTGGGGGISVPVAMRHFRNLRT